MILKALVLKSDVEESKYYDERTGAEKHGFWPNMTVLDNETYEKYDIQLKEGHPRVDELTKLRQQNALLDKLRETADILRKELPQEQEKIKLEVIGIKNNPPYLKLICRLLQEDPA